AREGRARRAPRDSRAGSCSRAARRETPGWRSRPRAGPRPGRRPTGARPSSRCAVDSRMLRTWPVRTTARAMGVEILDALDVLAVIFGVLFTVRKLDVSRREAQDFPGVDPRAFESWRRRESAVYTLGSLACVLKVVLDAGFLLAVAPH